MVATGSGLINMRLILFSYILFLALPLYAHDSAILSAVFGVGLLWLVIAMVGGILFLRQGGTQLMLAGLFALLPIFMTLFFFSFGQSFSGYYGKATGGQWVAWVFIPACFIATSVILPYKNYWRWKTYFFLSGAVPLSLTLLNL
jgi:hypothetical protein